MSIARSFRDLNAYRATRAAAGSVFKISKTFPREEQFALTDQIRRSSRATKAMIAEAWVRRRYRAVFINKLSEAIAEAAETQSWLDDALDCEYVNREQFARMDAEWQSIGAMLARMVDRASDFCKNAPDASYRVAENATDESQWEAVITDL